MRARLISYRPVDPTLRVLLATGTPVSESPATAYSALRVLAPQLTVGARAFADHFEIRRTGRGGYSRLVGHKNLTYLRRLLDRQSIRRLRSEIRGMPDLVVERRDALLGGQAAKHYRDLREAVLPDLQGLGLDQALTRTLRLRQFLEHPPIVGLDVESPKVAVLDDLLAEVLSNPLAKVVVWCCFVPTLCFLEARYREYGARRVDEGTTPDDLARLERSFDHDDTRVVLATPKKAGTGLDWLARARTAIYVSRPYSFIEDRQSQGRLVRRTAAEPKTEVERIKASPAMLIYLHSPRTVDDLVEVALARKDDLADAASPGRIEDLI